MLPLLSLRSLGCFPELVAAFGPAQALRDIGHYALLRCDISLSRAVVTFWASSSMQIPFRIGTSAWAKSQQSTPQNAAKQAICSGRPARRPSPQFTVILMGEIA